MCRSSPPALGVWLRAHRSTHAERAAFVFTSGDHTLSTERAIPGCDDRVAVLSCAVVPVQDYPVTSVPRAMGSCRIREQHGIAAAAAPRMENGEPRFT
jgi:hypothetical protein